MLTGPVQHCRPQQTHLLCEQYSVCDRTHRKPVQTVNNGWTQIHMDECFMLWINWEGGGAVIYITFSLDCVNRYTTHGSHLLSFHLHQCASNSLFPLYLLHPSTLHQPLLFFYFPLICVSSMPSHISRITHAPLSTPPLLHSLISLPLCLPFRPFSLPRHHLLDISSSLSSFPSWQGTAREAGTSTSTWRLCHRVCLCQLNPISQTE